MRLIAAATLMLIPIAVGASPPEPRPDAAKPACDRFARIDRAGRPVQHRQVPRPERLDRLPTGDLHLTVERTVGGCHIPVIVRQNIGRR